LLDREHTKQYHNPILLFSSVIVSSTSFDSDFQLGCRERGAVLIGFAAISIALPMTVGLLGVLSNDVAKAGLPETSAFCIFHIHPLKREKD